MRLYIAPACRHADGTISSLTERVSVWRVVSEDSDRDDQSFLLIGCTDRIFTSTLQVAVPSDTQLFQHLAKFY